MHTAIIVPAASHPLHDASSHLTHHVTQGDHRSFGGYSIVLDRSCETLSSEELRYGHILVSPFVPPRLRLSRVRSGCCTILRSWGHSLGLLRTIQLLLLRSFRLRNAGGLQSPLDTAAKLKAGAWPLASGVLVHCHLGCSYWVMEVIDLEYKFQI